MADDIGGIRSEVTADTSPLFAALQQAGAAMREWDAKFGKLTVQITAQMPTQQQMQQFHGGVSELLQKQGALQIPIQLVAPSQEDVRRTHQATLQGITATQAAAQRATPATQITRPPVQQAAAAADAGKSDSMRLAEAQAIANASGQPHQYQTSAGAIARAYPNVSRGGPTGGGGGFSVGGTPIRAPGSQEYLGGGFNNLPQLQEDLGRMRRENDQLRQLVRGIGQGGGAGRGVAGLTPEESLASLTARYGVPATLNRQPLTEQQRRQLASGNGPGTLASASIRASQLGGVVNVPDALRTPEGLAHEAERAAMYRQRNAGERVNVAEGDLGVAVAHEYGHVLMSDIQKRPGGRADLDAVLDRIRRDPPSGRAMQSAAGTPSGGEGFAEAFAAIQRGEPDRWGLSRILPGVGVGPVQGPTIPGQGPVGGGGPRFLTGDDRPQADINYQNARRREMRDLRRGHGYTPSSKAVGRTPEQVASGLSGLAKEVYDSQIAKGVSPDAAMKAVYDVLADEPPLESLKQLSGRKREYHGRLSAVEKAEINRLHEEDLLRSGDSGAVAAEATRLAGADRSLVGAYGLRARGAAGGAGGAGGGVYLSAAHQRQAEVDQREAERIERDKARIGEAATVANAAAAGGAGGGGGGGRRPPAAAPPPPPEEPARPKRVSTRRSTKDYSDEELIAAYRAIGRGPTITPTQIPGENEYRRVSEITGQLPLQKPHGGSPYRTPLTGEILSAAEYQRHRNAFRGRLTTLPEGREEIALPTAAEGLERGEGAHLAELGQSVPVYAGMSQAEQERELAALQGHLGPAAQAAAERRLSQVGGGGGGGRPGRGGGRPPGGPTRIPKATVEERAEIREQDPEIGSGRQFLQQSRELAEQARAGVQQRSLGTFITGLAQAGTGRPASLLAIRELDHANAEYNKRLNEQEDVQARVRKEEDLLAVSKKVSAGDTAGLTKEQIANSKSVEEQGSEVEKYRRNLEAAEKASKSAKGTALEAAKAIGEGTNAVRGLAAGFVGGIAGSLAYGVGITAVSAGIDLFTKATERGIGVLTGQIGVSQKVTDALSDQARQQHGLTSIATANAFAQTGVSSSVADTIRPLIEQRVALEAGSKAFGEQVDLLKTFQNLSQPRGPRQGIPGLTAGTGGVLGTQLFAQPGIAQQLAGLTPSGQGREAGGALGAVGGALTGAGIGFLAGGPFGAIGGALLGGVAGFTGGREIGGALGGISGLAAGVGPGPGGGGPGGVPLRSSRFLAGEPASEPGSQAAALRPNNVIAYTLAIKDLNDAAQRGAPDVANLGQAVAQSLDPEDIRQTAEVLKGLGLDPAQVTDLQRAGFAIQGIGDVQNFSKALELGKSFFTAAGQGAGIPDKDLVLERLATQVIPARQFQAIRSTQLANQLSNIQAGVATAAAPPLAVGATIPGGVEALSPQARSLFGGAQALQNIQVNSIDAARVEISNLINPPGKPGLGPVFEQRALGQFDRLQGLGSQAQGLQSFITQSQLGLQTAQFDEQIRLAGLQASDLAQTLNVISGQSNKIASSSYDNLGAYQGQLILLQRQSAQLQLNNQQLGLQSEELNQQLATLQLQLQQRQINFRVALAGFTAPGVTSEERAANIEQQEKEAKIAQRQLDIRRQILANQREVLQNNRQQVQNQAEALPLQFKVQDITLQRDYVTAKNALELLTRGRQVTIDVAGAQEQLGRVNNAIARVQNRLNNYIQRAAEFQGQLISDQTEFIETYSHSTATLLRSAQGFFAGLSNSFAGSLNSYLIDVYNQVESFYGGSSGGNLDPATGKPRQSGPQETQGGIYGQEGFVGHIGQRTQFTVGEAGGEEVAILRNPRQLSFSGGGGSQIVFNISINSPTVRSTSDMDLMARTIADAVEQRLSRRTSLLGFRPVGG